MRIIHMLLFLVTLLLGTILLLEMVFIPVEHTWVHGIFTALNFAASFANFYYAVRPTE